MNEERVPCLFDEHPEPSLTVEERFFGLLAPCDVRDKAFENDSVALCSVFLELMLIQMSLLSGRRACTSAPLTSPRLLQLIEEPCSVRSVPVDHGNVRHGSKEAFRGVEAENSGHFPVYQQEFTLIGSPEHPHRGVVHEVKPQAFPRPQLFFVSLLLWSRDAGAFTRCSFSSPARFRAMPGSPWSQERFSRCHAIHFSRNSHGRRIVMPFSTISMF